MKYDRKPLRLSGYDYSQPGDYFVTIVTQGRSCRFGEVADGAMHLSAAGQMVDACYRSLPGALPGIECLDHVVMPNHLHFIVRLYGEQGPLGGDGRCGCHAPVGLPEVVKRLKSITTVAYIRGVREQSWPAFDRRLWQKGYYDHIIRRQRVFDYIRNYIFMNPERWYYDKVNPFCSDQPDDVNGDIKSLY